MTVTLTISNKLISLRGRMQISDQQGQPRYEAVGQLALFSATWTINRFDQTQIARVRRKILAWAATWEVSGVLGNFNVKRKLLAVSRQYYIVGGPYDGAIVKGNIWDLNFMLSRAGVEIAHAAGEIFSLRDRHNIQVNSNLAEDEWLALIAVVVLHLDRRSEQGKSSAATGTQ